ncbi:vWA domain-containing protein [Dermabacteraceae bacterium P13138]
MALAFWWLPLVLLLLAVGLVAAMVRRRRDRGSDAIPVSGSDYLWQLPKFVRAQRRARIWRWLLVVSCAFSLVSVALLAGRPVTQHSAVTGGQQRDIVLCLDVSSSMAKSDRAIMLQFAEALKSFHGERIGLTIFNSGARTVFPLTTDYAMARRQLELGAKVLELDELKAREDPSAYSREQKEEFLRFMRGTRVREEGASLIPDGLVSCSRQFDRADQERNRSIIFVTDNEVGGKTVFSLPEAMKSVTARKIHLYTLYPGAFVCPDGICARQLQQATESADGTFYSLRGPESAAAIVHDIQRSTAQESGGVTRSQYADYPYPLWVMSTLSVLLMLLAGWRSRR